MAAKKHLVALEFALLAATSLLHQAPAQAQQKEPTATGKLSCSVSLDPVLATRHELGARSYSSPGEPTSAECINAATEKTGRAAPVIFRINAASGLITDVDYPSIATTLQNAAANFIAQSTAAAQDPSVPPPDPNAPIALEQQNPAAPLKGKRPFLQEISGTVSSNQPLATFQWQATTGILPYTKHQSTLGTAANLFVQYHPALLIGSESYSSLAIINTAGTNAATTVKAGPGWIRTGFTGGYETGRGAHGGTYEGSVDYLTHGCTVGFTAARRAPDTYDLAETHKTLHAGCDEKLPAGFSVVANSEITRFKNRIGFPNGKQHSGTTALLVSWDSKRTGLYGAAAVEGNTYKLGGLTGGDFTSYGGRDKTGEGGVEVKFSHNISLVLAAGRMAPLGGAVRTAYTYTDMFNGIQPGNGSSPNSRAALAGVHIRVPLLKHAQ